LTRLVATGLVAPAVSLSFYGGRLRGAVFGLRQWGRCDAWRKHGLLPSPVAVGHCAARCVCGRLSSLAGVIGHPARVQAFVSESLCCWCGCPNPSLGRALAHSGRCHCGGFGADAMGAACAALPSVASQVNLPEHPSGLIRALVLGAGDFRCWPGGGGWASVGRHWVGAGCRECRTALLSLSRCLQVCCVPNSMTEPDA